MGLIDDSLAMMISGGGSDITVVSLSATENITYTAPAGTAYSPVTVNVPANVGTKTITHDGTYNASSDNLDGYSSVVVDTGYKYVIPDIYEELDCVICPSWSNQAYFQVPFKLEIGDYIVTKSEISSDWNKNLEGDFIGDGNTWLIGYQNGQIYTWTRDISLYNFTGDPRDYVEGTTYNEIITVTANAANFNTYIGCYRPGDYRFKGKIFRTTQYRTSLSNENIPIMNVLYDLIPCKRKSDNVVGMYDAINNVFYTSVSSTAFVAPSE